ncbi:potassium transporter TrkG [Deinococcus lacus]|uniref:Potassium transporter TrkG n=1 Tax=Deinococcus lacus TaxID=392561 RepID=A0ABW1YFB5_9DEIO
MPVRRSHLDRFSPPQLIALSFAAAILLGALALWSPLTHEPGKSIDFIDALFMATSALCVTGLAVTDPGTTFNLAGELTMLLLIQVGGLGIITFGVLFALLQRRRVSVSERLRLAQQVNAVSGDVAGVVPFIRNIFLATFLIEALGALTLALRFVPEFGLERGAYLSIFHSVSAFNNAGFSLFPNNLMNYAGDALVSLTLAALFILGGMGVLAQLNVLAHWRAPRKNRLMTHTKMVLLVMLGLILIGFVGVLLLEWNNPATLGPLPLGEKLVAAFFRA